MKTACLIIALILAFPVCAEAPETPQRELIYGAELMTPQEREQYRQRMRAANSPGKQAQLRDQQRERVRERARERGAELTPEGLVRRK